MQQLVQFIKSKIYGYPGTKKWQLAKEFAATIVDFNTFKYYYNIEYNRFKTKWTQFPGFFCIMRSGKSL
jgi:hypothetical protein